MWTTKAQISLRINAVWSAPLLVAGRIETRFYSSTLDSSIGTNTVSTTCQFANSVLLLHVHLFKPKFHPAGTLLHRFCFPVSIVFAIKYLFDKKKKKKRFCDFWDTDFWILSGQWNQSLYGYIQKGYFVLDICKNSVWKLPLFSNCWQYEKGLLFAWKTTEASKGRPRVVCAMCPRI